MKEVYNMDNLNIIQDFIPQGNRNRPARNNPMNFVTIHETGNTRAGADALAHANFIKNPSTAVSWHYTTDDRQTVQHLPENEDAFHAGDGGGAGNRQSIGIEIAVNSDGNFRKAIERTAILVADICTRRNIPIENVRQHFDWSRKNCPENIRAGRPMTWAAFLDLVRAAMSQPAPETPTEPQAPNMVNFCLLGVQAEIEGYIQGGVTFVRARQLLEGLGYDVGWNGETSTVTVDRRGDLLTTAEELHYLQQIVDREARGEDLKGQILVANVVLNRTNDHSFPDTIIEVIKQSRQNADGSTTWQFTPASRPDFGTATVSETTIEAIRLALSGVDYSQGALFFNGVHLRTTSWAGQNRTHLFDHGGHSFYN